MPKSKTIDSKSKKVIKRDRAPIVELGSGNVFADLGFPPEEAINMLARAELMGALRQILRDSGWTQVEAAKVLNVAQPRVAEIMSMKTQLYSVDLLMKLLNKLGRRVSISIDVV